MILEMQQNTPEWHNFRKNKIGASDASIILGINPWKTPMMLWEEKHDLRKNEINEHMRRGSEMEDAARKKFCEDSGKSFTPIVMIHPTIDYMIASLDGLSENGEIVEIKCNGNKNHSIAREGQIPEYYYAQIQHQIEVSGAKKAYYYSFDGYEGVSIEIKRDDDYIEKILDAEKKFYKKLMDFEAPDLCDKDYKNFDGNEIWREKAKKLVEIKRQMKSLELLEKEIKEFLIEFSGRSNAKGEGIKLSKVVRKGMINYESIPDFKKIDVEKYRSKPVETWRIGM